MNATRSSQGPSVFSRLFEERLILVILLYNLKRLTGPGNIFHQMEIGKYTLYASFGLWTTFSLVSKSRHNNWKCHSSTLFVKVVIEKLSNTLPINACVRNMQIIKSWFTWPSYLSISTYIRTHIRRLPQRIKLKIRFVRTQLRTMIQFMLDCTSKHLRRNYVNAWFLHFLVKHWILSCIAKEPIYECGGDIEMLWLSSLD